MNYTTAIFLINRNVRAVAAIYEAGDTAPRTLFKTLRADLQLGDLCVVPTNTRHNFTVVKLVDLDVDVDFDSQVPMAWIVAKIDQTEHDKIVGQEQTAVAAIKSAEMRKKRDLLRESLLADKLEEIKALPIAAMENGDRKTRF